MKKAVIILAVLVILTAMFLLYKKISKKSFAATIKNAKASAGTIEALLTMDYGFLSNWADAVKNGSPVFRYKSVAYNSIGGRAVK